MPAGGRTGQGLRWTPRRAPHLGAGSHPGRASKEPFAQPRLHPKVQNSETPPLSERGPITLGFLRGEGGGSRQVGETQLAGFSLGHGVYWEQDAWWTLSLC